MKAIFSGAQLAHAPKHFLKLGNLADYPDSPLRAKALLAGARAARCRIFGARHQVSKILGKLHNQGYLNFLASAYGEFQALPGAGAELIPSLRPTISYRSIPKHILAKSGIHQMDASCPITASTWTSAVASAMTALTATSHVLAGDKVAYALCRPPGHHAFFDRASGFCYLNNAAIAAQHLRTKLSKVAILDIDVHHGNGTQMIFYARPDVLTVSIHADPNEYYPYYWGHASETGKDAGEGFNLNIPVAVKAGDSQWLNALDQALSRIATFAPEVLVLSLGLDAHEKDPLQGGSVTTGAFALIAEKISRAGLPTVIVQEGGYLTNHLSDNLAMFLVGFEGGLDDGPEADDAEDSEALSGSETLVSPIPGTSVPQ